jgi:cytochrome c oxidase subunit 3
MHAFSELGLSLGSGIYGSTFFLLTGFHGFHVTMGTIMLAVMLLRIFSGHFTKDHHFAFEAASWYWHFVDVVWLFLFTFVYWF